MSPATHSHARARCYVTLKAFPYVRALNLPTVHLSVSLHAALISSLSLCWIACFSAPPGRSNPQNATFQQTVNILAGRSSRPGLHRRDERMTRSLGLDEAESRDSPNVQLMDVGNTPALTFLCVHVGTSGILGNRYRLSALCFYTTWLIQLISSLLI